MSSSDRDTSFFVVQLLVSFSIFFDDPAKVTPRVTGVTLSLYTCVMWYCVITAPAYTSAGNLSLKQNGVVTFYITSGRTDLHTAHSTHMSRERECFFFCCDLPPGQRLFDVSWVVCAVCRWSSLS